MKRNSIRKAGSVVLASCMMVSLAGCIRLPKIGSTRLTQEDIENKLRPEIKVTEWEGDVPAGMEIMYVCNRKLSMSVSDKNWRETLFEHDGYGRQTAETTVEKEGTRTLFTIYNDDGTMAEKRYEKNGDYSYGYQTREYTYTYTYDDKGQLIACNEVFINPYGDHEREEELVEFVYEDGHLIKAGDEKYDYNFETLPYYEYVIEIDDSDYDYKVNKCYYDENNVLTGMDTHDYQIVYEYEDGVLTGWTSKDQWNRTTYFNAEGATLWKKDENGDLMEESTLNEHGDTIHYQRWEDGRLTADYVDEYEYDSDGNLVRSTSNDWYIHQGKEEEEIRHTGEHIYEYDDHGLLVAEYWSVDSGFSTMIVYSYEAILVPQT